MGKEEQKKLLIETMEADEKDGLYKTNNMAQQNENNELYDLEDLRSEYESTYLAYALFAENADFMNFEQWLEKHKGLKIK